jgi:hypothetical protein
MLMYCDNGGSFGANVHVKWSLGGLFTGGTTTTIPTATDEDGHTNQNLINFSTLPTGGVVTCNILHSSDGQHTRMFFSTQNVPAGFICTETAGSPGSLWTDPRFYARGPNGDLNPLIPPWVFNTIQVAFRGKTPAGNFGPINVLRDEVNESLINEVFFVPNEISGDVPLFTVGLYSPDVVGFRGRMGYLKDWWYTVNSVNPGDGFPGDASKQFIAIHTGVVVPWDGTTIVLG